MRKLHAFGAHEPVLWEDQWARDPLNSLATVFRAYRLEPQGGSVELLMLNLSNVWIYIFYGIFRRKIHSFSIVSSFSTAISLNIINHSDFLRKTVTLQTLKWTPSCIALSWLGLVAGSISADYTVWQPKDTFSFQPFWRLSRWHGRIVFQECSALKTPVVPAIQSNQLNKKITA